MALWRLALVARLVLGVAPGTPRLLAWQPWHLETSTFVSRGRRGTSWHLPCHHTTCLHTTCPHTHTTCPLVITPLVSSHYLYTHNLLTRNLSSDHFSSHHLSSHHLSSHYLSSHYLSTGHQHTGRVKLHRLVLCAQLHRVLPSWHVRFVACQLWDWSVTCHELRQQWKDKS